MGSMVPPANTTQMIVMVLIVTMEDALTVWGPTLVYVRKVSLDLTVMSISMNVKTYLVLMDQRVWMMWPIIRAIVLMVSKNRQKCQMLEISQEFHIVIQAGEVGTVQKTSMSVWIHPVFMVPVPTLWEHTDVTVMMVMKELIAM